jgi:hypothetical protein
MILNVARHPSAPTGTLTRPVASVGKLPTLVAPPQNDPNGSRSISRFSPTTGRPVFTSTTATRSTPLLPAGAGHKLVMLKSTQGGRWICAATVSAAAATTSHTKIQRESTHRKRHRMPISGSGKTWDRPNPAQPWEMPAQPMKRSLRVSESMEHSPAWRVRLRIHRHRRHQAWPGVRRNATPNPT